MINFFSEEISFKIKPKQPLKIWLKQIAAQENFTINNLNYIFCNDDFLLQFNQKYLHHNTLTDIITFQYEDKKGFLSGDIYISIERVKANSLKFNNEFKDELNRVLVHGLLHLCGYKDKSPKDKKQMRSKEDHALLMRSW